MKLKMAAEDLKYLLNRGYRKSVALKFVANHYLLGRDERNYLARYVFPDDLIKVRKSRMVGPDSLSGSSVFIDGYNFLIGPGSVLSGSGFFIAQDGYLRDVRGVFGNYRITEGTFRALRLIIDFLEDSDVERAVFYFDKNVSHSGKLRGMVESIMESRGLDGVAVLSPCVDRKLKGHEDGVVATSDGAVIDSVRRVVDIPQEILKKRKIR